MKPDIVPRPTSPALWSPYTGMRVLATRGSYQSIALNDLSPIFTITSAMQMNPARNEFAGSSVCSDHDCFEIPIDRSQTRCARNVRGWADIRSRVPTKRVAQRSNTARAIWSTCFRKRTTRRNPALQRGFMNVSSCRVYNCNPHGPLDVTVARAYARVALHLMEFTIRHGAAAFHGRDFS
jgi:hypothetical protein